MRSSSVGFTIVMINKWTVAIVMKPFTYVRKLCANGTDPTASAITSLLIESVLVTQKSRC